MKITMQMDISDLVLDTEALEAAISEEIQTTAYKVERTAKELCPVDTGTLRRSITTDGAGLEYDVFTNVEYAIWMEYGTSPHKITGNNLLWWEGAVHPVHEVNHPGTRAYLYMTTAFDTHTDDLEARIARIIEDVL